MLAQATSAGLASLVSEVLGAVLLRLPLALGRGSPLLVEDGEDLGDALSHNLKNKRERVSQEVFYHH